MLRDELIDNSSKRDHQVWRYKIADGYPHAHFKKKSARDTFKRIILDGLRPRSPYFRKAARRILTEEEYEALRQENKKDRYYNRGKRR